MRTVARAAALLAAVVVVTLLIAAAVVRLPAIQRWVAARVADRLPPGVTIERAALTLVPPGVQLTNVSLAAGGPQFASVSCRLRASALLEGRFDPAAVHVNGASLTVERSTDGTLQLTGPLAGLFAAPGSTSPATAAMPEPERLVASLPSVTVDDATVTFIDHFGHAGAHTLELNAIRVTLTPSGDAAVDFALAAKFAPAGAISAKGSVRETAGPNGVVDHAFDVTLNANALDAQTVMSYLAAIVPGGGTARAQGALDGSATLSGNIGSGFAGDATITQASGSMVWDEVTSGAPISIAAHITALGSTFTVSNGQLKIANIAAARIAATDLQANFNVSHGNLEITSAQGNGYGGTWSMGGGVTLADPPHFDVRLRAENVACSELLTAVTGERPDYGCERFGADATLRGQWTGAETVAQHARGSGHIQMKGGTIPSSSIIGALWDAIIPIVAARAGPKKLGEPTRVDRLTDSFTLRDARMQTTDLTLITDDYTVNGSGSIGLDGSLDLNTNIALSAAGMAKLFVMASLPVPGDVPNLPAIPTRVTGTVGSPILLPKVTELPLVALRGVFSGVRGAGSLLTEGAGKGLQGLRRELEKVW